MRRLVPFLFVPSLMAQSPRHMQLGDTLPAISLLGTDGKSHGTAELKTPLLMVVFLSTQCPYVRDTEDRINGLAKNHAGRMSTLGVNANANTLADEGLGAMKARAEARGYAFPYLKDADGAVAKAFSAVCTPDFFVFDAERKLAYHGRLDDAWGRPGAKRRDLEEAIEALLAGRRPDPSQMSSRGCSIK